MKKISAVILAISFLFMAGECSARTTAVIETRNGLVYVPNEATPFTGTLEKEFSNGQKQSEANYKDGKENGLATTFFDNGQKKADENYKNGQLNGLATIWFENGQKNQKATTKTVI